MVSISDKDRKILWGRSGNRCALCHRHILVAERTSADDDAVVGDEAHIAAQSLGGPRYGECARGEVDSYENLILLCKTDHKRVDDQPQHFTVARLRQIKTEHEAWVERTLDGLPGVDLDNPVIAAVENPRGLPVLTVDDDPPEEISRSGRPHVILLAGRTPAPAVTLKAMRPVVLARRPPRRVCRGESRVGAWFPPRPFKANLDPGEFDTDRPVLKAVRKGGRKRDFPFTVTSTDIEKFEIRPRVTTGEVSWILELDWLILERDQKGEIYAGTTIIDNDGKPFELYPISMLDSNPGLDWGCGLGHQRGCPAERLADLRRAALQTMPQQSDLCAAIEEEFPGWTVWDTDAGTWYARHVRSSAICYSETADGLRIRLREANRVP